MVANLPRDAERRGTRRFALWGAIAAVVLFAVVLVWMFVFVPKGQLGPTNARQTTPNHMLSNQGSGQSVAAKNGEITPEPKGSGGSGQNSSAEARQIEQTAKPIRLSEAQRRRVASYFSGKSADRVENVNFPLAIGAAVPRQVQLQKLPDDVSSAIGGFKGDQYLMVKDQLVIVDPNARRVVALVPNVG